MADPIDPISEPTVLDAAWRFKWLVLFLALAVAGLGWFYAQASRDWTAEVTLAVQDPRSTNLFGDFTPETSERYVESQAAILSSRVVAKRAARLLAEQDPPIVVDPDDILENLEVRAGEAGDLITVTYTAGGPDGELVAIAVANAVAEAYREVGGATAEFAFSAALASLDESIGEVEAEIASLQARIEGLLSSDPLRQELKAQLDAAKAELAELEGPRPGTDADGVDLAAARIAELGLRIETLTEALEANPDAFELVDLQTRQGEARERLADLRTRRDQLAVDAEVAGSGVAFIDHAEIAKPSSVGLFVGLGFLLGALLGVVIAATVGQRARRFDERQEPEPILRTRFIADIPDFATERIRTLLPVLDAPHTAAAESFRFVAAAIALKQRGPGLRDTEPAFRSVAAVSAGVFEGKSVVVANTAIAAAKSGARVLVVDADFGHQELTRILLGDDTPPMGLTDVERGVIGLGDAFVQVAATESERVSLLARGLTDVDPHDFFSSPRTVEILQEAVEQFDLVLLDTPPLLRVAYSSTIVGVADRALVVIRHGSEIATAQELRHQLDLVDTPLLGYVYNAAPLRTEMALELGSLSARSGGRATPAST
ncbi:MAG TPA: hypothetical protein ENK55_10380 [Actinobacteria bacterium]|nr:hypothetical protein [Actinomycetota bacterium]